MTSAADGKRMKSGMKRNALVATAMVMMAVTASLVVYAVYLLGGCLLGDVEPGTSFIIEVCVKTFFGAVVTILVPGATLLGACLAQELGKKMLKLPAFLAELHKG